MINSITKMEPNSSRNHYFSSDRNIKIHTNEQQASTTDNLIASDSFKPQLRLNFAIRNRQALPDRDYELYAHLGTQNVAWVDKRRMALANLKI